MDILIRLHYVHVIVYSGQRAAGERILTHSWTDLPWDVRTKWDWYFKYRAALYQVQYPRSKVEFVWGNYPAQGKTGIQIIENSITSKKRQITKKQNELNVLLEQLEDVKQNWPEIFPIEEDVRYQNTIIELDKRKSRIYDLKQDLIGLESQKTIILNDKHQFQKFIDKTNRRKK